MHYICVSGFLESVTATVNVGYGELSLASDTGSQYYGCADNEAEKLDSHRQPEPPAPAQSYYEDNWSVWTLWPGLRSPTVTLHLQPTHIAEEPASIRLKANLMSCDRLLLRKSTVHCTEDTASHLTP